MVVKELKSIFDKSKSFYKKAKITEIDKTIILKSYNTNILTLNNNKIKFCCDSWAITKTTMRHIKEFYKQFLGIFNITKKDILKQL